MKWNITSQYEEVTISPKTYTSNFDGYDDSGLYKYKLFSLYNYKKVEFKSL